MFGKKFALKTECFSFILIITIRNRHQEVKKMRILNPGIITKEEDVFITSIKSTFNSDNIGKVFKDQYNLTSITSTDCKEGDIIVYNEQIALQLGFEVQVAFGLLIDRSGNYLGITDSDNTANNQAEPGDCQVNLMESDFIKGCEREIISAIAASLGNDTLQELFEKEFKLSINSNPEFIQGSIVAYENGVAYKLEYEAQLLFNLLIDRAGNYLGPGQKKEAAEKHEEETTATDDYSSEAKLIATDSRYF